MNFKFSVAKIAKVIIAAICSFIIIQQSSVAQDRRGLEEVQEIIAIVNDQLISRYDLTQRTKLMALISGARELSPQQMQNMQRQAMQALIDDWLKIGEAEKYEAIISDAELDNAYKQYIDRLRLSEEQFSDILDEAEIDKRTILKQMRGSLSWQSIVSGLLRPQVNLTDDEVYNVIEDLERNKGKDEYQISEIFMLFTNNEQKGQIVDTAQAIYDQLMQGASFENAAQQFSQSPTATVGGDMGWIMESDVPDEVNAELVNLDVNEVSKPIITEDGVYIIQITDKRKILTVTEDDTILGIRYVFFESEDLMETTQLTKLNTELQTIFLAGDICTDSDEKLSPLNATSVGSLGDLRLLNLPADVREIVRNIEVGQGSNLVREPDGYRSFIICKKEMPEVTLPDFEIVSDNITQSRVQLLARRHLRDLRRDAIVDYR